MSRTGSTWSVVAHGTVLAIHFGDGAQAPQYAALHTESSYFRLVYGPEAGWGTSVVLLPSFWSDGIYWQGAPITTTWRTEGDNLVITWAGDVSSLHAVGELRLAPPTNGLAAAEVTVTTKGAVSLDKRPGEAFKPVMLSSMHVSPDQWDAASAFVNQLIYPIPANGWIVQPPTSGRKFGLAGGSSDWKTNSPTITIALDGDLPVTGWVTPSVDPNDDAVGLWPASDLILTSWHYTITASKPEPACRWLRPGFTILVDDFPLPSWEGEPANPYNRLGGERRALDRSILRSDANQLVITIAKGQSRSGVAFSLNHPFREGLPLDFAAVLPSQILPAYQTAIEGVVVHVGRGPAGRTVRITLQDGGEVRWQAEAVLEGGPQALCFNLPSDVGKVTQVVFTLEQASPGDAVVLESVAFMATTPITDAATQAFVWSYAMLLHNYDWVSGLVRDKAHQASGDFDAIQATGSLAAATALAAQVGVISHRDAVEIVNQISQALLIETPRYRGLLPHFVRAAESGAITLAPGTEYSAIDTVIAVTGLLTAQGGLGLDTSGSENLLQGIDWEDLIRPNGISMGYACGEAGTCPVLDVFGTESWLVALAYASATGQALPLSRPNSPTVNGAGFIDEMAWLFVPPPAGADYWGTDWAAYRAAAAERQIRYFPTHDPGSCFAQKPLFGLSAAEVLTDSGSVYLAGGVGGSDQRPNDGRWLVGEPVVMPHYSAMIASLRPAESIAMWEWLIGSGLFTPLNNVESLMFLAGSDCEVVNWNHLKGSWNLALQTLGWGRYLVERQGEVPVLWEAAIRNPLLRAGYLVLTPDDPAVLACISSVTPEHVLTPRAHHQFTCQHGRRGRMLCSTMLEG